MYTLPSSLASPYVLSLTKEPIPVPFVKSLILSLLQTLLPVVCSVVLVIIPSKPLTIELISMIPEILPKDILLVISVKLAGVVVKGCVFDSKC